LFNPQHGLEISAYLGVVISRVAAALKKSKSGFEVAIIAANFFSSGKGGLKMRYSRYLVLSALLLLPVAYSRAQETDGGDLVAVDQDSYVYSTPPVCPYGFYPYAPYACAPDGYWGPDWFVDGIFIGCGPWYHFY
jgi:hypothetical protein